MDFSEIAKLEVAMLSQVQAEKTANHKWIVFLGWAPHSMNERIDMTYLTGSTDATFGANDGTQISGNRASAVPLFLTFMS